MHLHLVEAADEDAPNTEKMFPTKSSEVIEAVALTKYVLLTLNICVVKSFKEIDHEIHSYPITEFVHCISSVILERNEKKKYFSLRY